MDYQLLIEVGLIVGLIAFLAWRGQLPSVESVHGLVDLFNTKGGNIILLATMAMIFFRATMHLAYVILEQIESHTLREDNAIALMAIQFCTTGAFGGAMGAMLTLISGDTRKSVAPSSPVLDSPPTMLPIAAGKVESK